LKTTGSINAFFSIRCKIPKSASKQFFKSKLLALGISLFTSFNAYAFPQFNKSLFSLSPQSTQLNRTENTRQYVAYANILRKRGGEHQYDAAILYLRAANKNDPEAQYWLGYMNLKGMGITEDDDEALKWIWASARQGYSPASILLNHILYAEVEADC
jgi:TPR repeat protein